MGRRRSPARKTGGRAVAKIADGQSDLEVAFAFECKARGWPEPEREYHYGWCCEHPEAAHEEVSAAARALALASQRCIECPPSRASYHDYDHARNFRADFAWPSLRLLVELQGGVYTGQAHGSVSGVLRDIERSNFAVVKGWRMLRFTEAMITDGTAAEIIEACGVVPHG